MRDYGRRALVAARLVSRALLLGTFAAPANAQVATDAHRGDSATVVAVVDAFHSALTQGDTAAVESLLSADAVILESGRLETRSEYLAHHLSDDIAFARAVRSTRTPMKVTVQGDAAWVSSTSTVRGEFNGRSVNSAGTELMVLVRAPRGARAAVMQPEGWLITAIHWSSRTLRP